MRFSSFSFEGEDFDCWDFFLFFPISFSYLLSRDHYWQWYSSILRPFCKSFLFIFFRSDSIRYRNSALRLWSILQFIHPISLQITFLSLFSALTDFYCLISITKIKKKMNETKIYNIRWEWLWTEDTKKKKKVLKRVRWLNRNNNDNNKSIKEKNVREC